MRILFQMLGMKRLLLRWNEHPLLHPPTSKIHKDPQTSLWSRGNEIYHSGIWRRDQWTRREGRSTHRVSIRVWTVNAETRTRSQEGSEREGMVGERDSRGFSDLISERWKLRCRIGIEVWIILSCWNCLTFLNFGLDPSITPSIPSDLYTKIQISYFFSIINTLQRQESWFW